MNPRPLGLSAVSLDHAAYASTENFPFLFSPQENSFLFSFYFYFSRATFFLCKSFALFFWLGQFTLSYSTPKTPAD
jgi:hypothetical protein